MTNKIQFLDLVLNRQKEKLITELREFHCISTYSTPFVNVILNDFIKLIKTNDKDQCFFILVVYVLISRTKHF